jgi:adenylate cyclase
MAKAWSEAEAAAIWTKTLRDGHAPLLLMHKVFRYMPSSPRCKICHNPFGGAGGALVGLFGFRPSRKNPDLCSYCCDALPPGGANVDVAVLFADVRNSSAHAAALGSERFAGGLRHFYVHASEILVRHDAIIDKLIGDEIMALFLPGIAGPTYKDKAARAAIDLLALSGQAYGDEPAFEFGVAAHSGEAYVGNVGTAFSTDLTAIGETVNLAAHLQGAARRGEALLSDPLYRGLSQPIAASPRRVTLKGGREVDAFSLGRAEAS